MRTLSLLFAVFLFGIMAKSYLYSDEPSRKSEAREDRKIEGLVVKNLRVMGQKALEIRLDDALQTVLLYDPGSKVLPPVGSHLACMAHFEQNIHLNGRDYAVYQLASNPPAPQKPGEP